MQNYYFASSVEDFISIEKDEILQKMKDASLFSNDELTTQSWICEIAILKEALMDFEDADVVFEYTIPRLGKRIDTLILSHDVLCILEFKTGAKSYSIDGIDQVLDYALDIAYFHEKSHGMKIIPILVCTEAESHVVSFVQGIDNVFLCTKSNGQTIGEVLMKALQLRNSQNPKIDLNAWLTSPYHPTPTIIEAATQILRNQKVEEITRSDAGAHNLSLTTDRINELIDENKKNQKKSIYFLTGIPGSGKTLAGLKIVTERHNEHDDEHAVFLTGNGPLVNVLQSAISRDAVKRKIDTKSGAEAKIRALLQMIYQFRDSGIRHQSAPYEKVVVFDEAQRAWNHEKIESFMRDRKITPFPYSEPEFLLSMMDRHEDWSAVICLVGEGQEIYQGEAGLKEWFVALQKSFSHWNVYVSKGMNVQIYNEIEPFLEELTFFDEPALHLATSIRSFRSPDVSKYFSSLLDHNISDAKRLYTQISPSYPICITRNLSIAKTWVKEHSRGSERYGMFASSKAKRLTAEGICTEVKRDISHYFLDGKDDIRSSYYFETVASEFEVQGLELDWGIVCWDADMRIENDAWNYYDFKGSRWNHMKSDINRKYLQNAYRVLLTRSRQGCVIYIPQGDENDPTRKKSFYDDTADFLTICGISELR